jgi:hypothetical protein
MKNFIKWLFGKNTDDTTKFLMITSDGLEAKRMTKSLDMALCLWDLQHNSWRIYKHREPDTDFVTAYRELISDNLSNYGINIDDLVE